ncbi:sensor histidine kinase, partial [Salmonella enterica subsp. enterica serovar Newport]|nr:sensor histidine kinase [Salmonella enterica subsp. enterica serovar Newport]
IGRFSAQRLGATLTLESNPQGLDEGLRVEFLWDQDFGAGTDLSDVFSSITRFPKKPEASGTILTIGLLRDAYSAASLDKIWRSVVLLQSPHRVAPVQGVVSDPGFQVHLNGMTRDEKSKHLSVESTFISQALALIEAAIEEDGSAWARVTASKLGLDERHEYQEKFLTTGKVRLSSYYFIYSANTLSGMNMKDAAEMGRRHGGIRIYRNGFRVLPYGEESNDWLSLDIDVSRRNFLFPANNRNFFGQIDIDSVNNPLFEETSSREGLLENAVFLELTEFAREAVEWAAQRIAEVRHRKTRADQRDFRSLVKPSELVRDIRDNLKGSSQDESHVVPKVVKALEQAEARMIAFETTVEEEQAASLEYENMLRLLASLGLSISVFGHEVTGAREAAAAYLMVLGKRIQALPDEFKASLSPLNADLGQSISRLFDIGAYISGLTSSTESRELHTQSVLGSVQRFADQFAEYMSKQLVEFTVEVQPSYLRTMPMHASELDAVLLNFLTNSVKSMKRAKVAHRKVKIDARAEGRHVVIGFEDNGAGIPQDIKARIFNAFFTTTVGNDDDSVMGPGTGLGLKIVSDISESYGGW